MQPGDPTSPILVVQSGDSGGSLNAIPGVDFSRYPQIMAAPPVPTPADYFALTRRYPGGELRMGRDLPGDGIQLLGTCTSWGSYTIRWRTGLRRRQMPPASPSQDLDVNASPAGANEAEPLRGGARQIDDHAVTSRNSSGPSVYDSHIDGSPVLQVPDADHRPEGVCGMSSDHRARIKSDAAGGWSSVEPPTVIRG